MTSTQASPSTYTFISWDSTKRIAIIQVNGCVEQTEISVDAFIPGVIYPSTAFNSIMQQISDTVTANMDPSSPNYDPSLAGD